MIKIGIVDDETLFTETLAFLVNNFEDHKVVLTARDGKDMVDKIPNVELPDIMLLDISMPEMNGFETAKWLQKRYPKVVIIMLTSHDTDLILIRLLQQGAKGFLKKTISTDELKRSFTAVLNKGYYYSKEHCDNFVNVLQQNYERYGKLPPSVISLTENEIRFLKLASTDLTYKEIAECLGVSPRTIDNYRDSLFDKLQVKSRIGMVIEGIRCGVISLESRKGH